MSGYIGNIPVPQATQTRDVFTATSGQTSFATSGYTPGFLDVWLNGVKLVNGTDFTATNGSDVVLASGAATSDIVEVLSYSTYEVNNQAFTGDFSVDGTTFKVDAANNRVGIGTATPDSPFVVNGSGARQKITDGTNTLSMGQFDGLTNQIGSAGRDLYLLASSSHAVKFGTNNTERMNIDTSGRVTTPFQPHISGSPYVTSAGSGLATAFRTRTAIGLSFSSGRITVPIAGVYMITWQTIGQTASNIRYDTNILINGTTVNNGLNETNTSGYKQRTHSICLYLSANDYIQFDHDSWYSVNIGSYDEWNTASVTLLG